MLDGTYKYVETEFRCQSCGHLFIEEEREFCDAPPISKALALMKVRALKEAEKQGEYLNGADTKLAELVKTIETVQTTTKNEADVAESEPVKQKMSIAEQSIRKEWINKKTAGRKVPPCEEYVRRRLAGELFE
jgi:hypothetical protein